jgi:histidine triad (HIT) family protein
MAKQKCIFCQIIAGELPATIIWQDDLAIAINDLYPQAPCHLLIIPKQHYSDITECNDPLLLGNLLKQATKLAALKDLTSGFRLVINTGASAGQSVNHIHIHLLGGRDMQWPPG